MLKNTLILLFFALVISLASSLVSITAWAGDEDRSPAEARANEKAQLKQYAGGKDEQEIKVQPSLPQPPKNIDGPSLGEPVDVDDHD
jgi:hypothetical protein